MESRIVNELAFLMTVKFDYTKGVMEREISNQTKVKIWIGRVSLSLEQTETEVMLHKQKRIWLKLEIFSVLGCKTKSSTDSVVGKNIWVWCEP